MDLIIKHVNLDKKNFIRLSKKYLDYFEKENIPFPKFEVTIETKSILNNTDGSTKHLEEKSEQNFSYIQELSKEAFNTLIKHLNSEDIGSLVYNKPGNSNIYYIDLYYIHPYFGSYTWGFSICSCNHTENTRNKKYGYFKFSQKVKQAFTKQKVFKNEFGLQKLLRDKIIKYYIFDNFVQKDEDIMKEIKSYL